MWIKSDNPAHQYSGVGKKPGFKTPEMNEYVRFNKNGKARVKSEDGKYLVEHYEQIHKLSQRDDEDESSTNKPEEFDD